MVNRSIYYWSKIYSDQILKGMPYASLKPTIVINILNFNLISKTELFHTTYHLYEDEEKFRIDDVMELHFIEIPKLLTHWKEDRLDPWNDVLVRWLLLLGMVDQREQTYYVEIYKELEAIAMKDEHLQDAFASWSEISVEPEGLLAYRARLKEVLDEESFLKEAELREEAAREEGIQKNKEDNARNFLAMGVEVEAVAQGTGLSVEQVQKIKERMNLS